MTDACKRCLAPDETSEAGSFEHVDLDFVQEFSNKFGIDPVLAALAEQFFNPKLQYCQGLLVPDIQWEMWLRGLFLMECLQLAAGEKPCVSFPR